MTENHPITPPPELVQEWCAKAMKGFRTNGVYEQDLTTQAARWGADQELEAMCKLLLEMDLAANGDIEVLRAARRPKPPSLKEQALESLRFLGGNSRDVDTIRRALEQLDTQAARWGADQELKACVDWMSGSLPRQAADQLRCVELIDCLKKADWPHRYKVVFQQWMDIAYAALAEPEGEGPTDEQLNDISARRPKPPSPKGEALKVLEALIEWQRIDYPGYQALRHALEQLDD